MTLQDVQAGDTLIRFAPLGRGCDTVTVERVTKTQIIINGTRFRKRDGREVNGDIGGWNRFRIRWPRDNEITELRVKKQRNQLCYEIVIACERDKLRAMPLETLRRIHEILGEENGKG